MRWWIQAGWLLQAAAGLARGMGGAGGAGVAPAPAPLLSPLAPAPVWSVLDGFQRTITREEFARRVDGLMAPSGQFWKYTEATDKSLVVYADRAKTRRLYELEWAGASAEPVAGGPMASGPKSGGGAAGGPLSGVRICLDPGHIGGDWARIEERHFQWQGGKPIIEAELNLQTCRRIAERLEPLGAEVVWTKQDLRPVAVPSGDGLEAEALRAMAFWKGVAVPPPITEAGKAELRKAAEKLFYLHAEIRARAQRVEALQPHLTLCVHYNAGDWGVPGKPKLVDTSRLVVFVHGQYLDRELETEDQKFDLMRKVLAGSQAFELKAADAVAREMADALGMPPETYPDWPSVRRTGDNPYVFARNLLANRIFPGPVVFVEGPYMNARDAYPRLVAGDFEGERVIAGRKVRSIFRDVADAVVRGVLQAYGVGKDLWPQDLMPSRGDLVEEASPTGAAAGTRGERS